MTDEDICTRCGHKRRKHHRGRCDATGPFNRDYCYCTEFEMVSDGEPMTHGFPTMKGATPNRTLEEENEAGILDP